MHAHPPASPQSSSYARGTSTSSNSRFAIDRVVKPKLLDFEYALWQMRLLLSQGPKKIYRHASYRKQTKNQWARDDPTFCVLSCAFVAIVAIGYCFAYEKRGVGKAMWVVLSAVFFDYVGCGCAIATLYWYLANRYMRAKNSSSRGSGDSNSSVEWLFAFDVHCNSFVPLFVALYVGQLILSPLLAQRGFICALLSNLLYGLSLSYYHYCQFVGFNSLPFLERTEFLLYPVVGLVLLAIPLSLAQFNPTRWVLSWYFGSEVLNAL
jgi:hypothetical protein